MIQGAKYFFKKYPLYSNEPPQYTQLPAQKFVRYGDHNDYPDYLAYLYNNSGVHSAIIQAKAMYVYGQGIKTKQGQNNAEVDAIINNINNYQSLNELIRQAILDRIIYGAYAFRIKWDATSGKPAWVKLQPMNTIRTNADRTEFYISKKWTREMTIKRWQYKNGVRNLPDDTTPLPAFDPSKKEGEQILFITDYHPTYKVYGLPEYLSAITSVETNIECGWFHLNNVKSGFSAGVMIVMRNGATSLNEEQKEEIDRQVKDKGFGTDNAGEGLIVYMNPGDDPPEVIPLRSNELDKQYEQLAKDSIDNICYGHRFNRILLGIKEEGQLGGRNEFLLAWEHFTNTYVKPKQAIIEEDINYILSFYGLSMAIELTVLEPVGIEITQEMINAALNLAEKRQLVLDRLGIMPIQDTEPDQPIQMSADPILTKLLSIGEDESGYEIVFACDDKQEFAAESDDELFKILSENKKITVKSLSERLKISESAIYKAIERLSIANKINVKYLETPSGIEVNTENINPDEPKSVALQTKYRYSGPDDSRVRPFCSTLLKSRKLWSRQQIESMSNDMTDFNTDVWKYRGGWYHDPERDVNIPHCRHFWQQVIVRKK